MASKKTLLKLFAALSLVVVAAMAFSLFTTTKGSHAAGVLSDGKPRFVHFSNHFSDTQLAGAHLKHWLSSFTSGGTTYKFSMVGTNPKIGSATTTVPVTIVPLRLTFSCSNVLEVGDPLVGVVFTVSGFSGSHLQDEAFFSWFARQKPSIAINGLYTYLGKFKALSQHC